MSSTLPQFEYFKQRWVVPYAGWTLTGHSRAMERTGFVLHEIGVVLDAGVDLPLQSSLAGSGPRAIFVSHGHIDHMNALPALLRHTGGDAPPTHVFAPAPIMHRLRQFCQLSWAVKVDAGDELPEEYAPPPEADEHAEPGARLQQGPACWRPVIGGQELQVGVGKKGTTPLLVRTTQLWHRATSIGYVLAEPAHTTRKLRAGLVGADKHATAANVKGAQARGETVHEEVRVAERPLLAFVTDTTVQALAHDRAVGGPILSCPTVMIECTYLEENKRSEAERRGHVHWPGLRPYVRAQREMARQTTWVLIHFSLRYPDEEVCAFFRDTERSGVILEEGEGGEDRTRPPDLVLWLDTGVVQLWVRSFTAAAEKADGEDSSGHGGGSGAPCAPCADQRELA